MIVTEHEVFPDGEEQDTSWQGNVEISCLLFFFPLLSYLELVLKNAYVYKLSNIIFYYYCRYRPGVLFIVVFCVAAVSVAQYAIFWIHYLQAKKKLEPSPQAKSTNDLTYVQLRKLMKRFNVEETPAIKKAIKSGMATAEILKMPELSSIEIHDADEEDRLAALAALEKPSIFSTLIFSLPVGLVSSAWNLITGKK